jgi:hypothetical protein
LATSAGTSRLIGHSSLKSDSIGRLNHISPAGKDYLKDAV